MEISEQNTVSRRELIEKAKKLKALADRGIEGEKSSAENFYKEFMEKHSLSESEFDDKKFHRNIKILNMDYEILLSHVILAVNPFVKMDKKKYVYKVVLDDEDYKEVITRTRFFYKAFVKEKQLLMAAFMERFKDGFIPDEKSVKKHHRPSEKMQGYAEKLINKSNPDKSNPSPEVNTTRENLLKKYEKIHKLKQLMEELFYKNSLSEQIKITNKK